MTKIIGRDALRRRFAKASPKGLEPAIGRGLFTAVNLVRAEAFQSISRGSVSGKGHVPSAPGQPPRRDTGVLQAHFVSELVKPLVAEFRAEAPYSAALEYGSSKMAERPFARPARDKVKDLVDRLIVGEINKELKD